MGRTEKEGCRACNAKSMELGVDLGLLPLANSLLSATQVMEKRFGGTYPLRVFRCKKCGLIQLRDVVDKREMFDDYLFLTSASRTSLDHFEEYAQKFSKQLGRSDGSLVVDIGSNDGTLLKAFQRRGAKVLGVEPARNLAALATSNGIETLNDYFGPRTAQRIGRAKANLVSANNVVSHVPDLNGFIESVQYILAPQGLFTFEVPWVVDVIKHNTFDIIYHEHLSYFGFGPLSRVLDRNGLALNRLEYFPKIHGGSLRGVVSHAGVFEIDIKGLEQVYGDESKWGSQQSLSDFSGRVRTVRDKLVNLLHSLKGDGKTITGYGAPAKATILLNYCQIDDSLLTFVTDTTPLKQGRFIPGVHLPIVPPDEFHKHRPDYALLLSWNYRDEILSKEESFLRAGGKFIVPFPEPEVVGWDSKSKSTISSPGSGR